MTPPPTLPSSDPRLIEAVRVLREGGLIALPTETVYGLAADAENELAVRRIFAVKGRPSTHPLIVHVADAGAAASWVADFPPEAQRLAAAFWPGPLTLIPPRSSRASDAVTGGQGTVAVRVPNHPLAQAVLAAFGGGLAAPSANRFGAVSPTTAEHVRADLGAEVELVLDGGPCQVGVESTIVDLSSGPPEVLRPGGVSPTELERVLGAPVPVRATSGAVRAPGLLPSHYAPRAGLVLASLEEAPARARALAAGGRRVALLSPRVPESKAGLTHFPIPGEPEGFARRLYAALREIDAAGFEVIVAVPPAEAGLGLAVIDRLTRAAAGKKQA